MRLKRVVIKEEFVALCGGFFEGLILNQMLYWTERVRDVDDFLEEERRRMGWVGGNGGDSMPDYQGGWVYKTADQLNDELMLGATRKTILKYLLSLCDKGYLSRRHNPRYPYDRTFQYRVNLVKVVRDLEVLGYHLSGYKGLNLGDFDDFDLLDDREERRREVFGEVERRMAERAMGRGSG